MTTDQRRQRILAEIFRTHAARTTARQTLDAALAYLAHGAARLAGCPPSLALIRVLDPVKGVRRQDVRANGKVFRPLEPERGDRGGVMGRACERHTVQIVPDVVCDPDYLAFDRGVRSEIALPLVADNACWGVLNLESRTAGYFTKALLPWLDVVAAEALLTIQGDAMRERIEQERVAAELWMTPDRLQVELRSAAVEAVKALAGRGASVEILVLSTEEDALVTLAFASENPAGMLPGRFAPDTTIAWRAVRNRQTEYFPIIERADPQTSLSDSRAALALPLFDAHRAVIGVLNVESSTPGTLSQAESIVQDARRHAEEILRRASLTSASLFEAVLNDIGDESVRLVNPRDFVTLYQLVLRRAVQMIGGQHLKAAVALRNGTELRIRPEHLYNYHLDEVKQWVWSIDKGITGRAIRERRSILVQKVRDDADFFESAPGTQSELVVPLIRSEYVLGAIDIVSTDKGVLTEDHVVLVEALAQQVVHALERAEQIRQGQLALRRVELIRETNQDIENMLRAEDPGELHRERKRILRKLVAAAMAETGCDYGGIIGAIQLPEGPSRADPQSDAEMVMMLIEPERDNSRLLCHWPSSLGITGRAFTHNRTIPLENVLADRDYLPFITPDAQSELAVPIRSDDEVLGVLNVESVQRHMYSAEEIASVELLASQIANVLSAAHLHLARRQLEGLLRLQREAMAETLFDGSDGISRRLQMHILQAALQLTEQPGGFASLWLRHANVLTPHGCWPPATAEATGPLAESERASRATVTAPGIIEYAFAREQPVLALDASEPPWCNSECCVRHETLSALAVPLLDPLRRRGAPGRVLGVLCVESPQPLHFSQHDITFMESLAQGTVAALHVRELYRSRIAQVRDITHTTEKALWPLRTRIETLKALAERSDDGQAVLSEMRSKIHDISHFADWANILLGWFQALVPGSDAHARIHLRPVRLVAFIQRFVERMRLMADDRDKCLQTIVPERDVEIRCEPRLLEAVLFLLTENALKYGPERDTVEISLVPRRRGGARVEIVDHGTHIPAEERPFLFDPGFRGSAGLMARIRGDAIGSGIGLDHVRRIVERVHLGRVDYEAIESGNRFYVVLPLRPRPWAPNAASAEPESQALARIRGDAP